MKVFFSLFIILFLFTGCVKNIQLRSSSDISESIEIVNNFNDKCKERYLQKQTKSSSNLYGFSFQSLTGEVKIGETEDKTYTTPKIDYIDGCVDRMIEQVRKIKELKREG